MTSDLELRLARLSKDLSRMQCTVLELLATVERPRINRRSLSPIESAQYAMLEAALLTPQDAVSELSAQVEEPPVRSARASRRSSALRG
ncbi:hypothetical protein ACSFBI_32955 [Variovorax sp. RB3P1]|uniref:hypothetical protein n=1 Tax=Variovorax sp. RB3P1 TaxID=3443732 RepID=UPI003F4500AB